MFALLVLKLILHLFRFVVDCFRSAEQEIHNKSNMESELYTLCDHNDYRCSFYLYQMRHTIIARLRVLHQKDAFDVVHLSVRQLGDIAYRHDRISPVALE